VSHRRRDAAPGRGRRARRWTRHLGGVVVVVLFAVLALGCAAEDRGIRVGVLSWAEVEASAHLWAFVLEGEGYDVELVEVDTTSPGGVVRTGEVNVVDGVYRLLADGDIDVWMGAWLPQTHAPQLARFGDRVEELGTWYEGASLTWAVPADVGVRSIADLEELADELGGRVVGIEPGSGHVRVSRDEVLPAYGLEDRFELELGSTPAMLEQLDRAVAAQRPIVVTLWRPHPAYGRYDLVDLDDPLGALGAEERIAVLAREGFATDQPDVASWLAAFEVDEGPFARLQAALDAAAPGDEPDVVATWVGEHRDQVDGWLGR
jgi:glycine betaine/proline transport system substrate-binding protein